MKKQRQTKTLSRAVLDSSTTRRWLQGLLLLAVALVFASLLGADFLYDDYSFIHKNTLIQQFDGTMVSRVFQSYYMAHYVPVTLLSFAFDIAVAGYEAWWFHLVNIVLHAGSTLLLFSIFRRLAGNLWIGFGVAFLFAVHPLHVESVAWISERKDVLSVLFMLAAWRVWLSYRETQTALKRRVMLYSLSFVLFCLAALSKVSAVVLPLVLLLGEYLSGMPLKFRDISLRLIEKIPFFAVALVLGFVGIDANSGAHTWLPNDTWDKIALASYSWAFYPYKLLLPVSLSAYYPYEAVGSLVDGTRSLWVTLAPWVVLPVLGSTLWLFFRDRWRAGVFALGFYTVTVLPLLSWVPVDAIITADRYSYVPAIGLFFLLAWWLHHLWETRKHWRRHLRIAMIAGGCLLAALAFSRTLLWKNTGVLFADVITKYPQSSVAHNNLATYLIDAGKLAEAKLHLDESIRLRPKKANNYLARAIMQGKQGDLQAAIESLKTSVRLDPSNPIASTYLGIELAKKSQTNAAIECFDRAIASDPAYHEAWFYRGLMHLWKQEWQQAARAFERVVYIRGYKDARTLELLQDAYTKSGQKEKAESIATIRRDLR